jgi:ABC-type glycerol-3-phosphate transport system permease component
MLTAPVGVQRFMQQSQTDWGMLLAPATVTMVPVFVVFMVLQRYMTTAALQEG